MGNFNFLKAGFRVEFFLSVKSNPYLANSIGKNVYSSKEAYFGICFLRKMGKIGVSTST